MVTNKKTALATAGILATALMLMAGCDRPHTEPIAPPAVAPPTEVGPGAAVTPGPAPTARSLGTAIDDTAITGKVKAAFVADPEVKALDISVETRKGEVQLSGFVDHQAQIARALDIARRTEGVVTVQNKLALRTPGTVGSAVDDALITAKVKAALVRDDTVKALDITVHTNKNEVQLSGYVDSETQISRAVELARTTEGVAGVDNKLSLKR